MNMMKIVKPFNDISIKRKFWMISFLGIGLPLMVLFFILTSRLSLELEKRMDILVQQGTERIEKQISNLFESINLVSYTYIADSYFNDTLNHFDSQSFYDAVVASNDIQKKIHAHTYSYNLIESIKIFHENGCLVDIPELEKITYEKIDPLLRDFIDGDDYVMLQTQANQIVFFRKLYISPDAQKNILSITFSQHEFSAYLQDTFLEENNGIAYLVDAENNILVSSNRLNTFEKWTDSENDHQLTTIKNQLSDNQLLNDWTLIVQYEEKSIFAGREDMFVQIGIMGMVIFMVALLLAYLISHSITKRLDLMTLAMDTSNNQHPKLISEHLGLDEIGKTARVYNHMVKENKSLIEDLEKSRGEAMDLLESKTNAYEELTAINEELVSLNEQLVASTEEIKDQDNRINELINMDSLTKLENRHSITQTIDMNIATCPINQKMAILFLDIDNFKYINDTHGHKVGDLVISETGKRLNEYASEQVDIGRFGGDEFLICIKGLSSRQAINTLIERINGSFFEPLIVDGNKYYLTVSIGISYYPEDGYNQNELVRKADQALYEAKNTGRNKYVVYDHSMGVDLEDKIHFQADIKSAYYNDEFYLNYQPYFDSRTKEIQGFEALIRWKSNTRGQVSPFELICNAEEMGLIVDIGRWVFKEACLAAQKFNALSSKPLTMSINLSAVQLLDGELFSTFMAIVKEIGIDCSLICLEMTETVLINSIDKDTSPFALFKEAGFKIALDDFGTGYSSLSYFKELPLSILKIDKSFVDHIVESDYDKDLIHIMVTIAHNKGVFVTAEGVESFDQYEQLLEYGCDTIQGYLLSKPLSQEEVIQLLSNG
jgi:diguanylate cyclase (GGDEF)-like protein